MKQATIIDSFCLNLKTHPKYPIYIIGISITDPKIIILTKYMRMKGIIKFSYKNTYISKIIKINKNKIGIGLKDKIIIYVLNTNKLNIILRGHEGIIKCLLRITEEKILSGSLDSTTRLWDINSGECLRVIRRIYSDIRSLLFKDPDILINISNGGKIEVVRNLMKMQFSLLSTIIDLNMRSCIQDYLLPNGGILTSDYDLGILIQIDEDGNIIRKYKQLQNILATQILSFDMNLFYIGTVRGELFLVDLYTQKIIQKLYFDGSVDDILALAPNLLLLVIENNPLCIIDLNSSKLWSFDSQIYGEITAICANRLSY